MVYTVDVKSLVQYWTTLASTKRYSKFVEPEDIIIFRKRALSEGFPFLTSVLPNLGKMLDRSFSLVRDDDTVVLNDCVSPFFLRGTYEKALRGDPEAVDAIRQLTLLFYKLEVGYEPELERAVLDNFCSVDTKLSNYVDHSTYDLRSGVRSLIKRILINEDPRDITPCHGSGSTACRTKPYDKWHRVRFDTHLDTIYPYSENFFFSSTHLADEAETLIEAEKLIPCARVVLVPKDSRGPRVISCEPAEYMYIQQGIMRKLYGLLESNRMTRGYINFTDQSINRELARSSSITGEKATLDLAEASDRVSWSLVKDIFPLDWVICLDACRSPMTELPDGRTVALHKFAPMGSSCCFPVEALVFWAIASVSIKMKHGVQARVHVYGDDIIIDSVYTETVIEALESVGLLVNKQKSFVDGPFRESCGGDFFLGEDVTPVRFRKVPSNVNSSYLAIADLCNEFIAKLGEDDALSLIRVIEESIGVIFPASERSIPGTLRLTAACRNDVFFRRRYNKDLQRFEHRIPTFHARVVNRRVPSWRELLRKELTRGLDFSKSWVRADHTGRSIAKAMESSLRPGQYADSHSVHMKWDYMGLS